MTSGESLPSALLVAETVRELPVRDTSQRVERYLHDVQRDRIIRVITHRDGTTVRSSLPATASFKNESAISEDLGSAFDHRWLRMTTRPAVSVRRESVRVVDLFSGCGAMTVGAVEAGRALGMKVHPVWAIDTDHIAMDVYALNFRSAQTQVGDVNDVLDSPLGAHLSSEERHLKKRLGDIEIALAGPPCQGHSNLNNHTRRQDPKNELFVKMARFAEVVEPEHLIIENVHGVLHDKADVFQRTVDALVRLGYRVDSKTVRAEQLGVPQRRHRVLLVASRSVDIDLNTLYSRYGEPKRTFDWACRDLADSENTLPLDTPSIPKTITKDRIEYLFEHNLHELPNRLRPDCHRLKNHTYHAVYGRMWGHEPAPTITTGFLVMGQGRFVHPHKRRTLTPHEGARLQFLPDWFKFGELPRRSCYAQLIGNAVPPKVTYVIAVELLR